GAARRRGLAMVGGHERRLASSADLRSRRRARLRGIRRPGCAVPGSHLGEPDGALGEPARESSESQRGRRCGIPPLSRCQALGVMRVYDVARVAGPLIVALACATPGELKPRPLDPRIAPESASWTEIRGSLFTLTTDVPRSRAQAFASELELFIAVVKR